MSEWELQPNPAYTGKPRILQAKCHDRTPFLTVVHGCGYELHFHEGQLAGMPKGAEIASRCHRCGEVMVFPPGHFQDAFAQMREDGWIE